MVGARRATEADRVAVAELRAAAEADARTKRGGDDLVDGASTVERPQSGATVVGLIGEAVVGVATLERDGRTARLTTLFTHPGARNVGVGHAMVAEVTRVAKEWGCDALDSVALPGDRDTKNFFESHGMKSRLLVVRTTL